MLVDIGLLLWLGSLISIGSLLQIHCGYTLLSKTTLILLMASVSACCFVSKKYKRDSKVIDFVNFCVSNFQPRTRWNYLIVGLIFLLGALGMILSAMGVIS